MPLAHITIYNKCKWKCC